MPRAAAKLRPLTKKPQAEANAFATDALKGLSSRPKFMSAKYFYDAEGSRLFEEIMRLPEYYPTRSEMQVLRGKSGEIAELIPPGAALVEFGSGSTAKIRLLLAAAPKLAAYVPVDISGDYLAGQAAELRRDFPKLSVLPVVADFTKSFELPAKVRALPRVGFFPGSTIGNFEPLAAVAFLRNAARILGRGALLIIGVDLVKDPNVLRAAYNDAAGVTAAFNLNLLARMNRELGANFDLSAFEHRAYYNRPRERIEMHLKSKKRQKVSMNGATLEFERGETIHTENSYKYTPEGFASVARQGGWIERALWTDKNGYFSVRLLGLKRDI
ncbi:MAG TPA: L-histidine N(alpha)-methyltransferase [Xanthobacteraceae bacterium]|nr:L-histidine N(alpha)-methyltransferase [Xanthobacteraceae bacterium]